MTKNIVSKSSLDRVDRFSLPEQVLLSFLVIEGRTSTLNVKARGIPSVAYPSATYKCGSQVKWAHWASEHIVAKLASLSKMLKN